MERKDYNPITLIPVLDKVLIIPTDEESEIIQENNKFYLVKKQPQYPKTYEKCCEILNYIPNSYDADEILVYGYMSDELRILQKLLVCRNAYWKIAGEQMGLGKPWEPDWLNVEQDKYVLFTHDNAICSDCYLLGHNILAFPTAEMRDAFYKNFNDLIEKCKELL